MAERLIIPGSAKEAAAKIGRGKAFLAGGTEINRLDSLIKADTLIMIKKISALRGIKESEKTVRFGAATTFQEALEDAATPEYMKNAIQYMAARTKRNMATLGGNIAICRDDSYLLPTLMAVDAKLELLRKDGGKMRASVTDYVLKHKEYANCLITAVIVPKAVDAIEMKRYANTLESHSYLNLTTAVVGGKYRIAFAIKNAGIFFPEDLAKAANQNPEMEEDELLAWGRGFKEAKIKDDMFGSREYKRYLLGETLYIQMRDIAKKGGQK